MKFNKNDGKTLIVLLVALMIFGGLLWAGDEYDIPGLKNLHDAFGG